MDEAPHLIEEIYNLEDALVVAQWMNVFLRKSDVLKIACLAQIVNVIAPIMTTRDGLLKQSIYLSLQAVQPTGVRRRAGCAGQAPTYETAKFGDMPLLDVSASYDEANNAGRRLHRQPQPDRKPARRTALAGFAPKTITAVHQLAGNDPKAANTFENPETGRRSRGRGTAARGQLRRN